MNKDLFDKAKNRISEYLNQGLFEEAETLSNQSAKVFDDIIFKQYLGISKIGLQKYEEAAEIFENNIKSDNLAEDFNNLSICLRFLKKYQESYDFSKQAISRKNNNATYYANLATTAYFLNKKSECLEFITKACELQPDNSSFIFDKANVMFSLKNYVEAEKYYRQGLKIKPVNEKFCVDLFYAMAFQNKFPDAWKFYEFRYNSMPHVNRIIQNSKLELLLEQKDYYSEKICISFEQGYGDNLMFSRFLPEFIKRAPHSYVLAQDGTFAEYLDELGVMYEKQIREDTTHIICLMSLPYHLQISNITAPVFPKTHSPIKTKKIKVGLAYAGSALHPMDFQRSTYLKWYEPFLRDDAMQVFSFMKDRRPRMHRDNANVVDYSENFEQYDIIDMKDKLTSVSSSMNALDEIDVFVTVDTFMAHIAGTYNVPTYLILSDCPDWRWGYCETETPWYPSVKIFRQSNNTLKDVIDDVYKEIRGRQSCLLPKED